MVFYSFQIALNFSAPITDKNSTILEGSDEPLVLGDLGHVERRSEMAIREELLSRDLSRALVLCHFRLCTPDRFFYF